jgi:hypothetical protein
MPTFRHGKNSVILFDKYDLSQYFTTVTTQAMAQTVETTTFGSAYKTYAVGQEDATISLEGLWSGVLDTTGSDAILWAALGSATKKIITVASEGNITGRRAIMLNTDETNYDVKTAVADMVKITATAQASGTNSSYDSGVLLVGNTVVNAQGSYTGVDNTIASTNGGVAHLHVTANTRNGAATIKVQHSANNSTWVDLVVFTNTSSATLTSERIEVAQGTAVNRYVRANVTSFAGSTGTATITVGFARR